LIESLVGAVRKLLNRRSSIRKKYNIVVSQNSENYTKGEKLAKYFDTPTTTLTTVSKIKEKKFLTFGYDSMRENTIH